MHPKNKKESLGGEILEIEKILERLENLEARIKILESEKSTPEKTEGTLEDFLTWYAGVSEPLPASRIKKECPYTNGDKLRAKAVTSGALIRVEALYPTKWGAHGTMRAHYLPDWDIPKQPSDEEAEYRVLRYVADHDGTTTRYGTEKWCGVIRSVASKWFEVVAIRGLIESVSGTGDDGKTKSFIHLTDKGRKRLAELSENFNQPREG